MQYALYCIGLYFHHPSHRQLGVVFALAASLHSFWSYFSTKDPLDEIERGEQKDCLNIDIEKTKIMASGPINSWQIDGETVTGFILGAPKSLQMVTVAMKLKDACSLKEKL